MGTVLHLQNQYFSQLVNQLFQSPSRWGRCCIRSVPRWRDVTGRRFSPLLAAEIRLPFPASEEEGAHVFQLEPVAG